MEPHGPLEVVRRHVLERTDFDDPCVVNQNINFAEAIDDLTNSGLNLVAIPQIALNGLYHAAAAPH